MKPELLSPVQDFTSLKVAIDAGADAIYFGIKELNMRIKAKNFELKDTKKVITLCHKNKEKRVKAYFTLNTIIYDNEIKRARAILKKLKKEYIDAIICWDYSIINECEKLSLPIHLSTQANVSNFESIKFLKGKIKNLKRINLARELTLEQISSIINQIKKSKLNVEIETFIHGAMCVSISGRCFLSQEIFNKSANRGECLQPCRRKYIIKDVEEAHELQLGEGYIISPKDLCTIDIIDKLIKAKISAFKIEGRNRSPEYVKTTTECYREAIDALSGIKEKRGWGTQTGNIKSQKRLFPLMKSRILNEKDIKRLKNKLIQKLKTVYNRGFSTGFYFGKPINEWAGVYGSKATRKKAYIGKVRNFYNKQSVAEIFIESGRLRLNDTIMFQGPTTGVIEQKITSMEKNHKKIAEANKGERIAIKARTKVRQNDKVFLIS